MTGNEGLKLKDVSFQGRKLLSSLSFPVMRVFYAANACGPFVTAQVAFASASRGGDSSVLVSTNCSAARRA